VPVTNSDNRLCLVSDSEAHLRSIIATLEENRAALVESRNLEAAQILGVAILQLRMRLHGIDGSELKAFCQAVQLHEAERARRTGDPRFERQIPGTARFALAAFDQVARLPSPSRAS